MLVEDREKLIDENRGLVYSIARRMHVFPEEYEDLVQEGMVGLIKGVDSLGSYDPKRGKLSTFLGHHITWAMNAYIWKRDNRSGLSASADTIRRAYKGELSSEIDEARLKSKYLALDLPAHREDEDEDKTMLVDTVVWVEDTYDVGDNDRLRQKLFEALKKLPRRERRVIVEYFGLDGKEPRSLDEIGEGMGYTGSRIGQIRRDAIKAIREGECSEWLREYYLYD